MRLLSLVALACVAAQTATSAVISGKPGMLIRASEQKRTLLQDVVSNKFLWKSRQIRLTAD
jgi:hypothetical protein